MKFFSQRCGGKWNKENELKTFFKNNTHLMKEPHKLEFIKGLSV